MTTLTQTKASALPRTGATALYLALVGFSLAFVITSISSIADRRATIAAEEDTLAQLEGRSVPTHRGDDLLLGAAPAGSPFLQGQTITVAGAALLQRIAASITKIGGKILSSQVDLQKADAKDGWIGLIVSCEIDQPSLQRLLYDVEAGMPFLFVDQLIVDAPDGGPSGGRLKVVLSVSGQWLERK
jgi:general secretion pathway protein M